MRVLCVWCLSETGLCLFGLVLRRLDSDFGCGCFAVRRLVLPESESESDLESESESDLESESESESHVMLLGRGHGAC